MPNLSGYSAIEIIIIIFLFILGGSILFYLKQKRERKFAERWNLDDPATLIGYIVLLIISIAISIQFYNTPDMNIFGFSLKKDWFAILKMTEINNQATLVFIAVVFFNLIVIILTALNFFFDKVWLKKFIKGMLWLSIILISIFYLGCRLGLVDWSRLLPSHVLSWGKKLPFVK